MIIIRKRDYILNKDFILISNGLEKRFGRDYCTDALFSFIEKSKHIFVCKNKKYKVQIQRYSDVIIKRQIRVTVGKRTKKTYERPKEGWEGEESGKVRKRKGKKVGDMKGVSGLTGPTLDRQRKKPDDTRS